MAYEVSGARATRRRPGLRGALLVAGVVLVVCCVGAAGLGLWNFQVLRGTRGPVRAAADDFLRDVSAGQPSAAAAYDRLCAATRDRWTREEFVRRATGQDAVIRYTVGEVTVATRGGRPEGAVTARLVRRGGAVESWTLRVVRDGDQWRVCGDKPI
ncbi:Rv0361 family membrane protein [Micromonospora zhanjiangensis]|uniref:DUF4878 domain-containing protein n=1 Tax=Micromonospora zhanjiangensis TaxID=1522057 RepID=A0ABV8KY30_9ACTN